MQKKLNLIRVPQVCTPRSKFRVRLNKGFTMVAGCMIPVEQICQSV